MKKQLQIIAVCFIGAFAAVNINAGTPSNIKGRDHNNNYKSEDKTGFNFGLDTKKGGFSISIGESSHHQGPENCSPYRPKLKGTIILICEGVRLYLPWQSTHAHLQKWYPRWGRWQTVKYYRVIR